MVWVKLDDQFPDHPKVVAAGPLAGWLHICGLAYSNRHLTDGFVPRGVAHRLADFEHVQLETGGVPGMFSVGGDVDCEWMAGILCRVGLWSEVEGGYQIHDFLDYQPSRAEVEALREARREAGRRGGQASAQARAKAKDEQEPSNGSSKTEADLYPVPDPVPFPESLKPTPDLKPHGVDNSPLGKLRRSAGVEEGSSDEDKIKRAMRGVCEADIVDIAMGAKRPAVRDRLGWVLSELKKRRRIA